VISSGISSIVGNSPWTRSARAFVETAAAADGPVLLVGPAGSGRQHLARSIHAASRRRQQPFVPIRCLPSDSPLYLAQVFGQSAENAPAGGQRGSATRGARSLGGVRAAEGGVVLFSEFDQASPEFQVRVLSLLRSGCVTPFGSEAPLHVNVRVLITAESAENSLPARLQPLAAAVARQGGTLFHTLSLAERLDDLEPLVSHFWRRNERAEATAPFAGPTPMEIVEAMRREHWSGDVAELQSLVEELSQADGKFESTDALAAAVASRRSPPGRPEPARAADH
jgi:DNA-binding NtrC family response regulator